MHALKDIRENPEAFDQALKRRGLEGLSKEILDLDTKHRKIKTEKESKQSERNQVSQEIGRAKSKNETADQAIQSMGKIKQDIQELEDQDRQLAAKIKAILEVIPNLPAPEVPDGQDEKDNVTIRKWGEPVKLDFQPKRHFDLGEALGMMDFETAANLSGARFVILRKSLARLERALANFMLDVHINEHGLEETIPPFLVRRETMYNTGQLPKFSEDLFHTAEDLWLIPTSEVPLTSQVSETILDAQELPKRYCAWTPCFRSEAGAAGRDTRGMIRQHQFSKVEMVSVTHPELSDAELDRMTNCAEVILQKLGLPYKVLVLCVGDMGFGARKTYDIEVWLPGEDTYREISSCSNCWDFQAQRMNARFRQPGQKGTEFVHTLNGSGLAVGRTMVAVLENGQQADGSILLPEVLHPYMGGLSVITA